MPDLAEFLERNAAKWGRAKALDATGEKKTLLLLTCIDLRYPSVILNLMEAKGYHKLYDQVALAGAGLAAVVDFPPHPKPHWQQTFVEHVAISSILHKISAVWIMDHRDCGAYRSFGLLGTEPSDSEQLKEFLA